MHLLSRFYRISSLNTSRARTSCKLSGSISNASSNPLIGLMWRLLIFVSVLATVVNGQCAAGTGFNASAVSGCSTCVAGYFCVQNSYNPYGATDTGDFAVMKTLAGSDDGNSGYSNGVGTQALFFSPYGVSISPDGTFALVSDWNNFRIRRIAIATGVVTTLAGSGGIAFADGVGDQATFYGSQGISISPDGSFALIADSYHHRIRRLVIDTGNVTTLAGSGNAIFADGIGAQASFSHPTGVSISPDGKFALVTDEWNNRIRRIVIATGNVTTVAGSGSPGSSDGVGALASFNAIQAVSISPDGKFALIAEASNHRIRRLVIATGNVTTLAGSGSAGFVDGVGTQASFNAPSGLSISADGTFALVAERYNHRISRVFIATGRVTTILSSGFSNPMDVAIVSSGLFALVAAAGSNRILQISLSSLCPAGNYCPLGASIPTPCAVGKYCPVSGLSAASMQVTCPIAGCVCDSVGLSSPIPCQSGYFCGYSSFNVYGAIDLQVPFVRIAGSGAYGFYDGIGTQVIFAYPSHLSISPDGSFALIADSNNNRIRRIAIATGTVTTLAGSSRRGSVDGVGTQASFINPSGVSILPDGMIALASDSTNNRIRRILIATGSVTTLAGSDNQGFADGVGSLASFNNPYGLSISPDGLFALVADRYNNRIRRVVISTGNVTTLAGSGSYDRVDGVGTQASFKYPQDVSISPDGTFALIADADNHRIRIISIASGSVTTLAGSGTQGTANGVGILASFNYPKGVSISPDGKFALVSDESNNLIRRIVIATGSVSTLGGSGNQGSDDGIGTIASFYSPRGLSISSDGKFAFIADASNNAIRRVSLASTTCSAGFYCPASSSSATTTICPAGSFCPAKSGSPVPCAGGYYCPVTGLSSADKAVACAPGSFCPPGSTAATICPTGSYCVSAYLSVVTAVCPPNQFCIEGAITPSITCFSGYTCTASNGVVTPCSSGYFCTGTGQSTVCPVGSFCPAVKLSVPSPCTEGFYCETTGLTVVTAACSAGKYCPRGSLAQTTCPVGSYCPSSGLSAAVKCSAGSFCNMANQSTVSGQCPVGKFSLAGQSICLNCSAGSFSSSSGGSSCSICPSGTFASQQIGASSCSICPAGTYSLSGQTACVQCPRGLISQSPGSSACYPCPSGSYVSTSLGASTCLTCSADRLCPFGSLYPTVNQLTSTAATPSGSKPVISDPFKDENAANQASIVSMAWQITLYFGPIVAGVVMVGLLAEKVSILRQCLTCCGRLHWQVLDLFFSESHFKLLGNYVRVQKTAFGAALSGACIVSMVALALAMFVSNLLYPQYSSSMSSQLPDWRPHGLFQLSVTVVGLGVELCSSGGTSGGQLGNQSGDVVSGLSGGVGMRWDASAWNVPASSTGSLSTDGSCTVQWRCGPNCQMLETASGDTTLRLVSTNRSAVSFVSYTLQLPSLTVDSMKLGEGAPFTLFSSFYSPNTDAQTMGALQGTATTVNLQLTPYVVASGAGATQMVAYQPSLVGVQFGDTITTTTFDFSNAMGFEIDFVLQRNTLSLVHTQSNPSIFNFVVLLASLMSSLVTVFGAILGVIERLFNLQSEPTNSQSVSFVASPDAMPKSGGNDHMLNGFKSSSAQNSDVELSAW